MNDIDINQKKNRKKRNVEAPSNWLARRSLLKFMFFLKKVNKNLFWKKSNYIYLYDFKSYYDADFFFDRVVVLFKKNL